MAPTALEELVALAFLQLSVTEALKYFVRMWFKRGWKVFRGTWVKNWSEICIPTQ